jgi:hypothetical protein
MAEPESEKDRATLIPKSSCLKPVDTLKTIAQDRVFAGTDMSTSDTPAFVLVIDGQSISVSTEMYEYLKLEAAQRGVSEIEIYREEMQAQEALKRLTLPRDRLEEASKRDYSHHPWWNNDETKPF